MNTDTTSPLYAPAPAWEGRDDGPGAQHARWHSVITPLDMDDLPAAPGGQPAVAVLGFASDEGVARNGGRQGAAAGPAALRQALGSLAFHGDFLLADAGTVTTQSDDLESAHVELSSRVTALRKAGYMVVVLGGGHETAFGSHRGALDAQADQPLQIVNLDAHFDLRQADRPSSGTPFLQIAELVGTKYPDTPGAFDYTVFGISKPNNTQVLFDTAQRLGVKVVLDEELVGITPARAAEMAAAAVGDGSRLAPIHLSIDLDVLPASTAPGVSAPASLGVDFGIIRALAVAIARTGRLALVDVVELNPEYDIDTRTAKAAARLINDIAQAHASARAQAPAQAEASAQTTQSGAQSG